MSKVLWLSRQDINALDVGPAVYIDLVRKTLEWHSEGLLEVPTKLGIHPPKVATLMLCRRSSNPYKRRA